MSPFSNLSDGAHSESNSPKVYFLYHALSEQPNDYSYTLSVEQFRDHASLFVEARKAGLSYLWPEVTFDDGHISNFKLALPILEACGLKAHFFITVGWTDRRSGYLGWAELRMLRNCGQKIGAHGWSHTFLTKCDHNQLKRELHESRLELEDKLGIEIKTMALPGGRYNRRVIAACKEAGYQHVYSSAPEMAKQSLPFLVGRVNARSEMAVNDVRDLLLPEGSAIRRLRRRYHLKGITKILLTDRLYDRLWWKFTKNAGREEPELETDEDSARYQ